MPSDTGAVLFYVGVDGGGSRCRVRICDAAGQPVGAAEGGSANVYVNFDGSLSRIEETIERAFDSGGLSRDAFANTRLGLGLAGVSSPEIGFKVAARLTRFAGVSVSNDASIACLGAHAGADGGLVIAGTGSAALLRLDGQETNVGGRGFILGDDGSGAVIGRQACRKALRAFDGLEPATPLLSDIMADFDDDPVRIIEWARAATSGDFGGYAPKVIDAAQGSDAAALLILAEAGGAIAELILTLEARGAPRISLVGGLAGPLTPYLGTSAALLHPPLLDANAGALLLAGAPPLSIQSS